MSECLLTIQTSVANAFQVHELIDQIWNMDGIFVEPPNDINPN